MTALVEWATDEAMRLLGAQYGKLQIYDEASGALLILAQRNFRTGFLEHFAVVRAGSGSVCSRVLATGKRVAIEDVMTDPDFEPHRGAAEEADFRAVQSTPLLDGSGKLLGVLSTHFKNPRRFSDTDGAVLDSLAEVVAAGLARELRLAERRRLTG